jgi:hypothetical protein
MRRTLSRSAFWLGLFIRLAAAATAAHADVTYYYTGNPFTTITPTMCPGAAAPASCVLYNNSQFISGDVVYSSPAAANAGDAPVSFSFTDGVNTITNTTTSLLYSNTENFFITTNSAGAVTQGNVGLVVEDVPTGTAGGVFSSLLAFGGPGGPNGDLAEYAQTPASGDCCLAATATSSTPGTWTESSSPPPPPASPPSLYVTVQPGGTLSMDTPGKPTSQIAHLTLSTTPVPGGRLLDNFPTDVSTLTQAAMVLGYAGFDWVSQITSDPNPDYSALAPSTPLTFPFNDPPNGGYAGEIPTSSTAGRYPFYYTYPITPTSVTCSSSTSCVPIETDTTLLFEDTPIDSRLRTSGGYTSFNTSLVGVISCSTLGVGECNSAGYEPGPTLFDFTWDDNFDGTLGGVADTILKVNSFYADPDSGTGGVTITSIDGVPVSSVPEPPSSMIFIFSLFVLSIVNVKGKPSV